jgi:methionyl aminopeptidase
VNEVICHGIPDRYKLQDGDICNIDVSVYHQGFHSDLNETYLVGNVDEVGVKLVKNARRCLDEAISLGRLTFSLFFLMSLVPISIL